MEIVRIISENPGNIVEPQANRAPSHSTNRTSSKIERLELNKPYLRKKSNQQITPQEKSNQNSQMVIFCPLTCLKSLARAYDLTLGIFDGNRKCSNRTCEWWNMFKKAIIQPDIETSNLVTPKENLGF